MTILRKVKQKKARERGKATGVRDPGQSNLVELICQQLASRFTPRAEVLYVGHVDKNLVHFNKAHLDKAATPVGRGKMPNVILHHTKANRLILVDAVPLRGPINPKRRAELRGTFADSKAGLVFLTAFLDRRTFVKHAGDISWETEVWIADEPSHFIHFDGGRLLGPYSE